MPSPIDDDFDQYRKDLLRRARAIEKRQRKVLAMSFFPAGVGLVFYVVSQYGWLIHAPDSLLVAFQIGAWVMFGLTGVALILTYLQTGFKSPKDVFNEVYSALSAGFGAGMVGPGVDMSWFRAAGAGMLTEELKEQVERAGWMLQEARSELGRARAESEQARSMSARVGEADKAALIADLKGQLTSETAKAVLDEIETKVSAFYIKQNRDREIQIRFEESRGRLSRELQALGRRGNLNLALGAITTVIGLYLLGTSVFQEVTSTQEDLWAMASHFLPRLTLVIMIELFAYFFLALYKSSLQEIKYFQNELTNVEAKQIALRTAVEYGDQTMVTAIVNSLAATERNHVLSKDQTTVELEKARIDREGRGDILKQLAELLHKRDR